MRIRGNVKRKGKLYIAECYDEDGACIGVARGNSHYAALKAAQKRARHAEKKSAPMTGKVTDAQDEA